MQFLIGILAGVGLFVITEWISRIMLEPVMQVRRAIGRVDYVLIMFANIYANPGVASKNDSERAYDELRGSSGELRAAARGAVWYGLFAVLRLVPRKGKLEDAGRLLIRLANSVFTGEPLENFDAAESIRDLLGVPENRSSKRR